MDAAPTRAGHTQGQLPLLGRDDVLARVDALLASCRAGHGSRCSGCTATPASARRGCSPRSRPGRTGAVVLRGTGWEDPGTPSFWVWSQVLRGVAAVRAPEQWGERGRLAVPLLDGTAEAQRRRARTVPAVRRGRRRDRATWPASGPSYSCSTTCTGSTSAPCGCCSSSPPSCPTGRCWWCAAGGTTTTSSARNSESSPRRSQRAASRGCWDGLPEHDVRTLLTMTTGRDPRRRRDPRGPRAHGRQPAVRLRDGAAGAVPRRAARSPPSCPSRHRPPSVAASRACPAGRGRARCGGGAGASLSVDAAGRPARRVAGRPGRARRRAGRVRGW